MRRLTMLFVLCIGLVASAHAGSAPEGYSSIKGYFLGFPTEAYFPISQSQEFLEEMERICKSKGNVWALGVASPFVCTAFALIEEGGNGPVYGVTLKNQKTIKTPNHALLFSVHPFPKPAWTERRPTIAEIDELSAMTTLKDKKHAIALKHLRAGKGQVIEPSNGEALLYVVPGRITSDGIVDERNCLLIAKFKTGGYETFQFRGKVVGLADLNSDGIPELQISTNCDGTCESVMSVVKQSPVRLDISNH